MDQQRSRVHSLLENEDIRQQVSSYIREEVLLPEWSEDASDIEVIQENDSQYEIIDNSTAKSKKKLNESTTQANDSYINVCGLQVGIKSLLTNEDIRKQLAPFIEEVTISDYSDCSDVEEIMGYNTEDQTTNDTRNELNRSNVNYQIPDSTYIEGIQNDSTEKLSVENDIGDIQCSEVNCPVADSTNIVNEEIVMHCEPIFEEVILCPDVAYSSETIEEAVGKNLMSEKESILINENSQSYSIEGVEIFNSDDFSDDEIVETQAEQLEIKSNESINKRLITEEGLETKNNLVLSKSNSGKSMIKNQLPVVDDDNNSTSSTITHEDDASYLESDDWYYLNMPTCSTDQNSANEKNEDLITETDVLPSLPSVDQTRDVSVPIKKRRKRRKKQRWTFNKTKKNNVGENTGKIQLQGKIVKRKLEDIRRDVSNLIRKTKNITEKSGPDSLLVADNSSADLNNGDDSKEKVDESIVKQENVSDCDKITTQIAKLNRIAQLEVSWNKVSIHKKNAFQNMRKSSDLRNLNKKNKNKKTKSKFKDRKLHLSPMQSTSKKSLELSQVNSKVIKRQKFGVGCLRCGKVYERIANLRRHTIYACTGVKETIFECALCPYKTKNAIDFKDHLGIHILGVEYFEKNDNSTTIEKIKLNETKTKGIRKLNYSSNLLKARCTKCKVSKIAVENQKVCNECGTILEYWCALCGKTFYQYLNLNMHFLFAKDCNKCNQKFTSVCERNKHRKICSEEKHLRFEKLPYVRLVRCDIPRNPPKKSKKIFYTYCSKCERTSEESEEQAECIKCKTLLSYKCEICGDILTTHSNLRSHVLTVHIISDEKSSEHTNIQ